MANQIYANDFARVFSRLLEENGLSCYRISEYTNLDQAYLSRLRRGKMNNPSLPILIKLSLALARLGKNITIHDIEELFNTVGRSILIR